MTNSCVYPRQLWNKIMGPTGRPGTPRPPGPPIHPVGTYVWAVDEKIRWYFRETIVENDGDYSIVALDGPIQAYAQIRNGRLWVRTSKLSAPTVLDRLAFTPAKKRRPWPTARQIKMAVS